MAEQTLNIPQILAVIVVGFLAIRWFLSPTSSQGTSSRNAGRQINQAHVDLIMSMFPQLDRRSVMWEMQRNGGSVQATTERVLTGRRLDMPPPSFQPPIPRAAVVAMPAQSSQAVKPALPDLITRYNLSTKIVTPSEAELGDEPGTPAGDASKKQGWSANKTERSELLKTRREEMILAARRKMEARDKS